MTHFERIASNPIIFPGMPGLEGEAGANINGPSLIRLPDWIKNPLGRYYLYFAHHSGQYIRIAYADTPEGPWRVHSPGVLQLKETASLRHIASPDVHVDAGAQRLRMYFHGDTEAGQRTFLAFSDDGLTWEARPQIMAHFYLRAFTYQGAWYGIAKYENRGGILQRSPDGIEPFQEGPRFLERIRHAAIWLDGNLLHLLFTQGKDCPESILYARMTLDGDWSRWPETLTPARLELRPNTIYEGVDLPITPSQWGAVFGRAHQLRDPAVLVEGGRIYLVYAAAGESCLALATGRCPVHH